VGLLEVIMRVIACLLTLVSFLYCAKSDAQTPVPPLAPGAQPQGAQKPVQQYYAEDGGTREVLESIVIPPKAKAPFSLVLQTEWVKMLSDGGTITLQNERRIARDSSGRIYQERWLLAPKNGKAKSQMTTIQISDPNRHTHINCFIMDRDNECVLTNFTPSTNAIYKFEGPPTGEMPNGQGSTIHEDLGKQFISGMETTGTRDTVIYNPGVFGNDRKVSIEREYWYSPELGLNLLSKRSDPRIGTQSFTATQLIPAEPDAKLFELPEGYRVIDRRQTSQPQN
jgi:hypothetical protein